VVDHEAIAYDEFTKVRGRGRGRGRIRDRDRVRVRVAIAYEAFSKDFYSEP
jgi:hypothetical protein